MGSDSDSDRASASASASVSDSVSDSVSNSASVSDSVSDSVSNSDSGSDSVSGSDDDVSEPSSDEDSASGLERRTASELGGQPESALVCENKRLKLEVAQGYAVVVCVRTRKPRALLPGGPKAQGDGRLLRPQRLRPLPPPQALRPRVPRHQVAQDRPQGVRWQAEL